MIICRSITLTDRMGLNYMEYNFLSTLPPELASRLNLIITSTPKFWADKIYFHFTNHGPTHSERVFRFLTQLIQELPKDSALNSEELFIIMSAAWLYEIGMQSPRLKPILEFEYKPGNVLGFSQLQQIREKKHLLSSKLIYDCLRGNLEGRLVNLGLPQPPDKYAFLIAEVCRWCSNEPLDIVPDSDVANGSEIRFRLLVALLRLADQLYIDSARVNFDLLKQFPLNKRQLSRWWMYHYTQTLPITNGQIRFNYFLPAHQKEYLDHIRMLIESDFKFEANLNIQYLIENQKLNLVLIPKPDISLDNYDFQIPIDPDILSYLQQEKSDHLPSTTIDKSVTGLDDIVIRINALEDNLGKKLNDLKRGHAYIYNKIEPIDLDFIDKIYEEIHLNRIEQGELRRTVDATQRAMRHILTTGSKIDDPQLIQTIKNIYESVNSSLSLDQQFEFTLPIIPFLASYKLSLGAGVDLGSVWNELISRLKAGHH